MPGPQIGHGNGVTREFADALRGGTRRAPIAPQRRVAELTESSRRERVIDHANKEGGRIMKALKSVMLGLAVVSVLAGLSACAQRPVVMIGGAPAPAPSAAVQPAR